MRPGVRAWVRKAEADYRVATRESRVRVSPSHDAVCFHAQQCVEKYFKAVLLEAAIRVPRTHDLALLWSLLPAGTPITQRPIPTLGHLTVAAVEYRYPGRAARRTDARRAVRIMAAVRRLCRQYLALATP